jgi:hypothetical protein
VATGSRTQGARVRPSGRRTGIHVVHPIAAEPVAALTTASSVSI